MHDKKITHDLSNTNLNNRYQFEVKTMMQFMRSDCQYFEEKVNI